MAASIGIYYSQPVEVIHTENKNKWHDDFMKALQFRLSQRAPELSIHTYDIENVTPSFNEEVQIFIYSSTLMNKNFIQSHLQKKTTTSSPHHFFVFNHPVEMSEIKDLELSKSYFFFYLDNETELISPLSLQGSNLIQQLFWNNIHDLARDILVFFKKSNHNPDLPKVYLATTSEDIVEFRMMIRRELEEYGFNVLPKESFAYDTVETITAINELLEGCQLSIHLIGNLFEEKLDDDSLSLSFLQNTIAAQKSQQVGMKRLIWFPPKMLIEDERQEEVVKHIRQNPKAQYGAEIFEAPIEELKFAVHEQLALLNHNAPSTTDTTHFTKSILYIICNQSDVKDIRKAIKEREHLFQKSNQKEYTEKYTIVFPDFSLRGSDFRNQHLEMLKKCEAAIIYYGTGSKNWLDAKLSDFLKISGYGRQKPWKMQALYHKKPLEEDYQTRFSNLKIVSV